MLKVEVKTLPVTSARQILEQDVGFPFTSKQGVRPSTLSSPPEGLADNARVSQVHVC